MGRARVDPRAELLIIIGVLTVLSGAAVLLAGTIVKPPVADVLSPPWLFAGGAALGACGIGLMRLRRWAGAIVAVLSIGAAVTHVAFFPNAPNVAVALLLAAPGAAIIRWRRFLR